MALADSRCRITLEQYKTLKIACQDVEAKIDIIDIELLNLRDGSYITIRQSAGHNMLIGGGDDGNRSECFLPDSFYKNNKDIIEQHRQLLLELNTEQNKLYECKKILLKEMAENAASDLIRSAKELEDAHAKIYALGKNDRCLNVMIWRELKVPATVGYGNLNKISEKPNGREMLCYPERSDKLAKSYGAELRELLA